MRERSNPGPLEFEKRVLAGVEIDGMDLAGSGEEIIENVSAGARDDQDAIGRRELKRHPVERGVFPAGVEDQMVPDQGLEEAGVKPLPFPIRTRCRRNMHAASARGRRNFCTSAIRATGRTQV